MKKRRGSITVEATIILPIYILVLLFVLNFMNIFYTQLAVQEGLNSTASTVAQYCYVADLLVGVDRFSLSEETSSDVDNVVTGVKSVQNNLDGVISIFSEDFELSKIGDAIGKGEDLLKSVGDLGTAVKGIANKEDIVNLLLAGSVEAGGSAALSALMNSYLDKMKINRNLIDGPMVFTLAMDSSNSNDLVLSAYYHYKDPMLSNFVDTIDMKQSVVVHPWIGGVTEGLRQK